MVPVKQIVLPHSPPQSATIGNSADMGAQTSCITFIQMALAAPRALSLLFHGKLMAEIYA